jgi:hypothetical protein
LSLVLVGGGEGESVTEEGDVGGVLSLRATKKEREEEKKILLTLNDSFLKFGLLPSLGDAIHGADGLEGCL